MKVAPTCFRLQGNHHQGTTTSIQLKIQAWINVDTDVVQALSVLWRHMRTLKPGEETTHKFSNWFSTSSSILIHS
jgi:hypothetical protein